MMARYTASWKTANAGSSTLPMAGLMAATTVRPRLVEVGVFNTTATAVEIQLRRITAIGTSGATVSGVYEDDSSQVTAITTPKDAWSLTPTFLTGNIRQVFLGAAIGSGIIWTFGGGKTPGIIIPNTTNDGVVLLPVGTGQICDVYFTWDE